MILFFLQVLSVRWQFHHSVRVVSFWNATYHPLTDLFKLFASAPYFFKVLLTKKKVHRFHAYTIALQRGLSLHKNEATIHHILSPNREEVSRKRSSKSDLEEEDFRNSWSSSNHSFGASSRRKFRLHEGVKLALFLCIQLNLRRKWVASAINLEVYLVGTQLVNRTFHVHCLQRCAHVSATGSGCKIPLLNRWGKMLFLMKDSTATCPLAVNWYLSYQVQVRTAMQEA